jgi:hypothetical protein
VSDRRRLPAYAADLAKARRRGMAPRRLGFGHVAVVLGWQNRASAGLHRIVFPPDAPLAELDLACFAGLNVFMTHTEAESARAAEAVERLLAADARWVEAVNLDALDRGMDLMQAWVRFEQGALRHGA